MICGHIHHAEIRDIDGILYCNDGDWVESCSALVEHADGKLEIIKFNPNETRTEDLAAIELNVAVPKDIKSWVSA